MKNPVRFIFTYIILSIIFLNVIYPQSSSIYKERRDALLGLHFNFSNYNSQPFNTAELNSGYFLSFLSGISGKYDYVISAGSTSLKYPVYKNNSNERNNLLHHIDAGVLRRFFTDTVLFNPFLGAGVKGNYYSSQFFPSASVNAGIQLRLTKKIFIHTQFDYQFNFSSNVNNNTIASIGILGTILQRKKKVVNAFSVKAAPLFMQPIDTDKDGIPDAEDACPTVPGPKTYNGCPDSDGDGIPDNIDECPTIPGYAEYKGCPAPSVTRNKIDTVSINVDTINNVVKNISTDSISTTINTCIARNA